MVDLHILLRFVFCSLLLPGPSFEWVSTVYTDIFCFFFETFPSLDISTDGIWCYIVLWVVPHSSSLIIRWSNLKDRLLSICPPCSASFYFTPQSNCSAPSPVYLLKFFSLDRKGLLHGKTAFCLRVLTSIFLMCSTNVGIDLC